MSPGYGSRGKRERIGEKRERERQRPETRGRQKGSLMESAMESAAKGVVELSGGVSLRETERKREGVRDRVKERERRGTPARVGGRRWESAVGGGPIGGGRRR